MAADILGQGLGRHVDPVIQRPEGKSRRPGIVHQRQDAPVPGQTREGRGIRHFKGLGGRALDQDQPGLRRCQRQDGVRRRIGRIEDRPHAKSPQQAPAESPDRLIDAIGDEDHVPRLQDRHQRAGQGRQPRPIKLAEPGIFQLAQGLGQGHLRGQALASIGRLAGVEQGCRIGQQDGRGLLDGRPDRLGRQAGTGSGGGMHDSGLERSDGALRLAGVVAGIGHAQLPVTTGVSAWLPHSVHDPS